MAAHGKSHNRPRAPERRLVLLGASNLSYGLATIVGTARRMWRPPLEVLSVQGHGRSYGRESWVLGRGLGSILDSRLWEVLPSGPRLPTTAIVTDVGNDLLYDIRPEQLADWVEQCFVRLRPHVERMVVTELPLDAIGGLSDWWYLLLRTVQFPRCRLDRATVVGRAVEVNARLVEIAARHGVEVVRPPSEWYGIDPIHIRTPYWPIAWREILSRLDAPPEHAAHSAYGDWLYYQTLEPAEWKLGTRRIAARQPAGRLADGTTVALY